MNSKTNEKGDKMPVYGMGIPGSRYAQNISIKAKNVYSTRVFEKVGGSGRGICGLGPNRKVEGGRECFLPSKHQDFLDGKMNRMKD
jgi:hypothetical protein